MFSVRFSAFTSAGIIDGINNFNRLNSKLESLKDYYALVKSMKSEILVYKINNPTMSLVDIAKRFLKESPDAKVMGKMKISLSGENLWLPLC